MDLIDIGANLTHSSFEQDFDAVIAAAREAHVSHIMLTGTDLESSQAALSMAQQNLDYFSSTAGFHPHAAKDVTAEAMHQIEQLLLQPEVVAVGETGLDFNRNFSPAEQQLQVFEEHLQLAAKLDMPVFLHQRDAHIEFLALLSRYRDRLCGGVVHCFTDTADALKEYLSMDMYIGITGWICDERRGLALQKHVKLIPDNRLLIETDAPYLLPRSLNPRPDTRRNEPKYLPEVLRMVAQCRGQTMKEVAALTIDNAKRLFNFRHLSHSH